jgi:radical SAM superfamily enzyme YgiQ (UPF0313 family)/SAM-dependent methyltransferase
MQLKIGFIQAKNDIDVNWFKPLAFGYLKAYLEKYLDIPVSMYFLESLKNPEDFDIIAISSTSQDFAIAGKIARSVKQRGKEIITILGGHHITYLPQTLPKEIDVGVMGEGEQTFLELVRFFFRNSLRIEPKDLKNIKGIIFHENDSLTITPRRELISPLDNIPFPYRSKSEKPYLFSSRGCPYKCAFCSSSAFWKKTRFFSAEYVVNEIEFLLSQSSDLKHIAIWDDLFVADAKRLDEIVTLIEQKGINKKISFDLAVRANLVDDELCRLLKRMNVVAVGFGAESGANRILKFLNKGVTVESNQNAIDTLNRYGILIGCSFIVGCPTETEAEVRSTYEFILKNVREGKLSPTGAVNILMPMPGTEIWSNAVKSGLIDIDNIDWNRLAVWASYRNSNINNFKKWVQLRQKNNTIYLAEDTLPQTRLYKIMYEYEEIIKNLEKNRILPLESTFILSRKMWDKILPAGTIRRKAAKAIYQLFFDWNLFKHNIRRHYFAWRKKDTSSQTHLQEKTENKQVYPFPESALAHKYCVGKGLEIGGSAHNPFGLNTLNVDFTDSMETKFKKEEIRLCGKALKVDIVTNGDDIPLPDESQDFIVSSHIFEHLPNPIKALVEWDRLVRPGGVIFMIVPHKERTFDKDRPRTSLEHVVNDYLTNNTESHNDPNDHDHCWITEDVVNIVNWVIANIGVNWEIAKVLDVDDKVGNGFTLIIRKTTTWHKIFKKDDVQTETSLNVSYFGGRTLGKTRKLFNALYLACTDYPEFRSQLSTYLKTKKRLQTISSATSFERAPIRFLLKRTIRRLAYALTVFSDKYNTRPAEYIGNADVLNEFLSRCRVMDKPRVLELGTKRSIPDRSTRHDYWVPNAREYLGSDIESGPDVEVVADAHRLSEVVGEKQFDIIISCSTFEHLKYPHLAAHQLMKALKIGGVLYIQTHQSFPLHAYPYDYFRFSREALAGLFGTKIGFRVIATGYSIPLSLYSPHLLDRDAPAFANVQLYGEKIGETPNDYVYEFDCSI